MSTDRRRVTLAVASLGASVLLLSPVSGTQAAFVGSTANSNTVNANADWTPPTISDLEAWKPEGGTPGFVRSPGGYRMIARVVDDPSANPPSGVATVTSPNGPSTLTTAGAVTLGGVAYTHVGQLITIVAGRAAATLNISADATDVAGFAAATFNGNVILENTAPAPNFVDLVNKTGGIAGRAEVGDTVRYRWNEIVEPHVMVPTVPATTPPSGWSGAAATTVTVRITNGTPDTLNVLSPAGAALPFGSINLGGNGYVAATVNFTGSTITWTDAGQGFTIVLGTPSAATTTVAGQTAVWTPSNGAIDRAGNPSTTATVNESGANDLNF